MHKSEHHTILYPSDPQELAACCNPEDATDAKKLTTLPAAILTGHASYEVVLPLLHNSFSQASTLKPKLVVILGSLHQEPLEVDKPHFLFTQPGEGITLPNTTIRFATEIRDALLALFPDDLASEQSYFIEEPGVELTLPVVGAYFAGVPALSLLTNTSDPKECRTYGTILARIVSMAPETLFVVSANCCANLPSPLATSHSRKLVSLLESGAPLLDELRSRSISSCGIAAFEALRRQSWGVGRWEFTKFATGSTQFASLPIEHNPKERIVWHASAKRIEA
ncbi:AmmeMemoRadiSam system protein B [Sphaerochaeta sp. PS]|uniref:AmmeMemoRadiSam system protein B n=1 Tax=Sphaerochaeta sp. PS TaxID=3076336 RepID=UPI0028A4CE4A|nr:AmmeMemoRadiSam system protein B [Sphaerochaeta sp. PS]MDT4763122.1 AmmeMemoRadiSam system protein B [Sphaerochaeta sp. PS]